LSSQLQRTKKVAVLIERLTAALAGIEFEVVFVDDSLDTTAEEVRRFAISNRSIRVLQRVNRRGSGSACVEGMMTTAAPYVAVMDTDLQHDESVLLRMLVSFKGGAWT